VGQDEEELGGRHDVESDSFGGLHHLKKNLFRNGELSLLWPDVAARCRRARGMGGQDAHATGGKHEKTCHPLVDARRRLCAGFRQCGLFVEVCTVDCVLSLGGGWCWCWAEAQATRSMAACARGPPSSTSASTSCLSRPVLPRLLWRVVGWVGILLDVISGVERALWEGCYPALTLAPTCGANRAS
jgi:hypothetical protein